MSSFWEKNGFSLIMSFLSGYLLLEVSGLGFFSMLQKKLQKAPFLKLQNQIERKFKKKISLNEGEIAIAAHIVDLAGDPSSAKGGMDKVGGNSEAKKVLRETIILRIKNPHLFTGSNLLSVPKGILLHGPPGTGKTMMVRAVASETGIPFINVKASSLFSKWFGESEQAVANLFSLARKLEPCVLFIDEIDGLLNSRDSGNSADAIKTTVITEFMAAWDGIESDPNANIIIVGATNRPHSIDVAVQRRFSRQVFVGLPAQIDRLEILELLLYGEGSPAGGTIDFEEIARKTEGYSGSDLAELCRAAKLRCVTRAVEDMAVTNDPGAASSSSNNNNNSITDHIIVPKLCTSDILAAMSEVKATSKSAAEHLVNASSSRRY